MVYKKEMQNTELKRELGLTTAVLVVIASMIGAGIFGTTGYIQEEVQNPLMVMGLWILGGIVAISGALCYAELSSTMPHAGGEYVYIKKTFGALPSFLTGWVSLIVGFSASAASSALLTSDYAYQVSKILYPGGAIEAFMSDSANRKVFASVLVVFFGIFHMSGVKKGGFVQNVLTTLKILIIVLFTGIGLQLVLGTDRGLNLGDVFLAGETRYTGFGVGLLFVMIAYSGWNGATYLAEEIKNPEKNVPRALFWGTLFTIVIYFLLNLVYYLSIPVEQMKGMGAVAALSAENLFGTKASLFFNLSFIIMLFSSVSVSLMIGPRVYYAMARDHLFFKSVGNIHGKYGTPFASIVFQVVLTILYIVIGKIDEIFAYMGFALSIFPIVTVLGLFVIRKKIPKEQIPYKTKFFPLFPLIFISFSIFIMITSFIGRPVESSIALLVVLAGIPVYYSWTHLSPWAVREKK